MKIKTIDDVKKYSIKEMFVFGVIGLASILIFKSHILESFILDEKSLAFIQLAVAFFAMLAFACIIFVICRFWLFLNCLRIKKYMLKNNIDYYQDIVWWNNNNCFFMHDIVIIYGLDFSVFKYKDIESIQVIRSLRSSRRRKHYYYTYDVLFFVNNGNRYKAFCCNDSEQVSSEIIESIKNIILLKNDRVNVMETRKLSSFEELPFWWK